MSNIETAGKSAIENVEIISYAVVKSTKDKKLTSADKYLSVRNQGADPMLLLAVGKHKKDFIEEAAAVGFANQAENVANAKYRTPIITLAAAAGVPFSFLCDKETGDVPRKDWIALNTRLQELGTTAGKKAAAMWVELQAAADKIRERRMAEQQKLAA